MYGRVQVCVPVPAREGMPDTRPGAWILSTCVLATLTVGGARPGLEWARWTEVEVTGECAHCLNRLVCVFVGCVPACFVRISIFFVLVHRNEKDGVLQYSFACDASACEHHGTCTACRSYKLGTKYV